MLILKPVRMLGVFAVLASVPLITANAQVQVPAPVPPPAQTPMVAPRSDNSFTAPTKAHPLLGLAVFSADGIMLGAVDSVAAGADGKVVAIHIRTGGFLGLGSKLVAIPESKFFRSGEYVQLGISAEEVSKLPDVKGQS